MTRFLYLLLAVFFVFACSKNDKLAKNNSANKALIEQYFNHFNKHEWQKMADMYVDQAEMKDPAYGIENIKMNKADIVKKYTELNQIIPDIQDKILHIYESGENVIVEFESTGTAPDQTKFTLPICTIFEIKNGKISKDLTYYDNFE